MGGVPGLGLAAGGEADLAAEDAPGRLHGVGVAGGERWGGWWGEGSLPPPAVRPEPAPPTQLAPLQKPSEPGLSCRSSSWRDKRASPLAAGPGPGSAPSPSPLRLSELLSEPTAQAAAGAQIPPGGTCSNLAETTDRARLGGWRSPH